METQRCVSKTGRKVTALFVVFHMPPAAAATKNVLEGLGIPAMSATRPSKLAGPTVRHRKPARVVESRVCADALVAVLATSTPATKVSSLCGCIRRKWMK